MDPTYVELSALDVGFATGLVVINGAISIALRLGMERTLAVASLRTVLQLALLGLILDRVFAARFWYLVGGVVVLMTAVAAVTAVQRADHRYPGIWLNTLVSVWVSSWTVTGFALLIVLGGAEPWYRPQYVIPLLGMVLGNTLNGISIGMGTFTEALVTRRDEVEALLALGATRWEAARPCVQRAVRAGMVPIINSMMVVGIVSLPGMMTGQIIAGADPAQAVKYQIVIMFLVASATALGTVGVVLLGYCRLFNADHQFLHGRIRERR